MFSPPIAHTGGPIFEPLQVAGITLLATMYLLRSRTLAEEGRAVPGWRVACFFAGLLLITAALVSPVAHIGSELVLAHMSQHLLMADIGAALLVAGLTGPLLAPLLAVGWLGWARKLTHPLIALPLWAANLYLWHWPLLYQATLGSEPLHALQHLCFVGFGVLMWMPLFGPLPKPQWFGLGAKLVYVVAVRLAGTVLGNIFMWSGTVLYPDYAQGERYWGISPLSDQGTAGVIMTAEGGILTLGLLVWLLLAWAKQDTERQRLLDLADQRGLALDESRAGRAVAAGQGARLEKRLREGGA